MDDAFAVSRDLLPRSSVDVRSEVALLLSSAGGYGHFGRLYLRLIRFNSNVS